MMDIESRKISTAGRLTSIERGSTPARNKRTSKPAGDHRQVMQGLYDCTSSALGLTARPVFRLSKSLQEKQVATSKCRYLPSRLHFKHDRAIFEPTRPLDNICLAGPFASIKARLSVSVSLSITYRQGSCSRRLICFRQSSTP